MKSAIETNLKQWNGEFVYPAENTHFIDISPFLCDWAVCLFIKDEILINIESSAVFTAIFFLYIQLAVWSDWKSAN